MPPVKTKVTENELHAELVQAFARIKPLACKVCTVPKPRVVPDPAPGAPNWTLPNAPACEFNCPAFVRWLWRQYGTLFDIDAPA